MQIFEVDEFEVLSWIFVYSMKCNSIKSFNISLFSIMFLDFINMYLDMQIKFTFLKHMFKHTKMFLMLILDGSTEFV